MKMRIWVGLVVLLYANAAFMMLMHRQRSKANTSGWEAPPDKENRLISEDLSVHAEMSRYNTIDLVGNLAAAPYWTEVLPLSDAQKVLLAKLDEVVRESRYLSRLRDAQPYHGSPADRRDLLAVSKKRQIAAIRHAQRIVALGLLTEQQAALVTKRHLESAGVGILHTDDNAVELLEPTADQRAKLARIGAKAMEDAYALAPVAFKTDPQSVQEYRKRIKDQTQESRAATWAVLTPSQRATWHKLTSTQSLPAEPPNSTRSALSDSGAETASIHVLELSPIFRALAEKSNAVGLSAEQKSLMAQLREVVVVGFVWIGRSETDGGASLPGGERKNQPQRIPQMRAEYLKHAEQVALLSILTERQAEQVQAAVKGT